MEPTPAIGAASPVVVVAVLAAAVLAVRFNRALARGHVALFKGSREPPRWWQMLLLRSVWILAGVGVIVVVLLALVGAIDL
jgi:uncharacterized BrkB/YihY/UPF0761 family membrane protein